MMLYSKIQARLVLTPRLAWWWHVSKAVVPKLKQECLLNSSPQRFWCFKPVSWKTIFPPDKDKEHGLGMIQGHYTYCLLCFSSNLPLIWQDVLVHGPEAGDPEVINEDWWVLWASRFLRFFFLGVNEANNAHTNLRLMYPVLILGSWEWQKCNYGDCCFQNRSGSNLHF